MSIKRIKAILLLDFFISKQSLEIIFDVFIFPIFTNIIVFGFFTLYLTRNNFGYDPTSILIGMIYWQPIFVISYSIGVGSLWNIWAKNLTNIFISPISTNEYLIAYSFSGLFKGLLILILGYIVSFFIFKINVFSIGLFSSLLYFINVSIFGLSFGIFCLGLVFRFGTRIQALSWGLIFILQPIMAVIYPVSILPKPFQFVAYLFPPKYVFEAIRNNLSGVPDTSLFIVKAFLLNILWFIFSIYFFRMMLKKSKEIGQFSKLEI